MTADVLLSTVIICIFLSPIPSDYSLMPPETSMYDTPWYNLDIEKIAPVS